MSDDLPLLRVAAGNEIELTYRLDYKSAEVKRLPDAEMYTHVTTQIQSARGELTWPAADYFSKITETVAVTEDDQLVTFVTRVRQTPWDEAPFTVTTLYGNGSTSPDGEAPIPVAQIAITSGGA